MLSTSKIIKRTHGFKWYKFQCDLFSNNFVDELKKTDQKTHDWLERSSAIQWSPIDELSGVASDK